MRNDGCYISKSKNVALVPQQWYFIHYINTNLKIVLIKSCYKYQPKQFEKGLANECTYWRYRSKQ